MTEINIDKTLTEYDRLHNENTVDEFRNLVYGKKNKNSIDKLHRKVPKAEPKIADAVVYSTPAKAQVPTVKTIEKVLEKVVYKEKPIPEGSRLLSKNDIDKITGEIEKLRLENERLTSNNSILENKLKTNSISTNNIKQVLPSIEEQKVGQIVISEVEYNAMLARQNDKVKLVKYEGLSSKSTIIAEVTKSRNISNLS